MFSKTTLFLICAYICMGVASCPRELPEPPKLAWGQCAIHWPKDGEPALYCVDPETGQCVKGADGGCMKIPISADRPAIKGAQCLFPYDYQAMSQWWDAVLAVAQKRCD